jgi:hypothetical protein
VYEDVALTEMKIGQWGGIVIYDDAVFFVYHDRDGWVLVADLIETPQELNCWVVGYFSSPIPRGAPKPDWQWPPEEWLLRNSLLRRCLLFQLGERSTIYRVCIYSLFRGFLKAVSRPPQYSQFTSYRFVHAVFRSHQDFPRILLAINFVRLFSALSTKKNEALQLR